MISDDAKGIISDILDLFSQVGNVPIALYLIDSTGHLTEVARSPQEYFPAYCQAIWKLSDGRGREVCYQNKCEHASKALADGESRTFLCHAGLTITAEPILIDDAPIGVVTYGAHLVDEAQSPESEQRPTEMLHRLEATPEEAHKIKRLLLNHTPTHTQAELRTLRNTLPPILSRILHKYLYQYEKERTNQRMAYHELQLRMQAAMAEAENLKRDIEEILPSNNSLNEQVQNVLGAVRATSTVMHNLTRGEYLPAKYQFRRQNILHFINTALSLVLPLARRKHLDIIVRLKPDNNGCLISASKLHLQEAFNNLLQNAVKYSYSAPIKSFQNSKRFILIQGHRVDNRYKVSISNYGVGIEPDELEKIFEEGYKGRLTRSEYRTGSGLGLPLVKDIIEAHQGSIAVFSEPINKVSEVEPMPYHTQFSVWLPIALDNQNH